TSRTRSAPTTRTTSSRSGSSETTIPPIRSRLARVGRAEGGNQIKSQGLRDCAEPFVRTGSTRGSREGAGVGFEIAIVVLLFAVLIGSATTDIISRKVPHWITLPAIAFGLALSFAAGDLPRLESSLLGLGIASFVFGLAYVAGGVGGGDLKL